METILKIFAILISVVSTVVNSFVIVIVFQARHPRAVNMLIANWSLLTCISSIGTIFYFGDGDKYIQGPWTCPFISFLRNWLANMYPLHVLAIVYESCCQLQPRSSNLLVLRTVGLCWILSGIGAAPYLFGTTFSTSGGNGDIITEKCAKVPIFNNVVLCIIVETLRAFFFHLGAPAYMSFLLYKWRGKLKYLKTLKVARNPVTLEKWKRVRFIFAYTVFFIVLWVPFGLVFSWYQVFRRSSPTAEDATSNTLSSSTAGTLFYCGIALFYVYILFSPVIVLWTGDTRLRQEFMTICSKHRMNHLNHGQVKTISFANSCSRVESFSITKADNIKGLFSVSCYNIEDQITDPLQYLETRKVELLI